MKLEHYLILNTIIYDGIFLCYNEEGDDVMKLMINGLIKYILGFIIVGLLVFVPAGTLSYFNGWVLMGVVFIPILIMGIVLLVVNPSLLAKRLDAKEKQKEQSDIVKYSGLMFLIGFIIAGISYRMNFMMFNRSIVYVGVVVFLLSYLLYGEVLRENTYLSRTIEVVDDQKVIDNGLYGIVRHPMYSITVLLFLSIPLILGSLLSLIVFLIYPFLIAQRIRYEEIYLEKHLKGYKEYKNKVKYKLIPFIY